MNRNAHSHTDLFAAHCFNSSHSTNLHIDIYLTRVMLQVSTLITNNNHHHFIGGKEKARVREAKGDTKK